MSWLQVRIYSEKDNSDAVTDILNDLGAEAVTYEDDSETPIFEPAVGETPLWQQIKITGLFAEDQNQATLKQQVTDRLTSEQLSAGIALEKLEDQVWERSWMDKFQPMKFGDRLWICPTWNEPPDPKALNIIMDPGLAFGSGSHPTTSMCLSWLSQQDLTDQTVIDYGCGSGVLGIAASLLAAKKVWGVDLDPQALIATRNNSLRNHCENVVVALPEQLPQNTKADLIVANILAGPLANLVDVFWELSHLETEILLSGVLSSQAEALIKAYAGKFQLSVIDTQEDWVLLQGFCAKNVL